MYGQATQQYAAPGGGQGGQFRRPPANNGPMAAQFAPVQPGFNPAMQRPPVGYAPPAAQPYRGPAPPGPQYAPPAQYAGGGYAPPRPTTRQHKGTLPPGQMVRVGQNIVRVERYLSEGGYAHVYLTSSERPIYPPKRNAESKGRWGEQGFTQHCLKRIAFNDDNVWADVSKEIEVMKSLPPCPHLIQYLDSSHHRLPNGTHEVFILMEVCQGGGIIDLLNKRLRDRLKEIEILNIFTDVCEAVAAMHALSRPLLHRDLKIENVLSHPNGLPPTPQRPTPLVYKLCDFGSTTFPSTHPPSSKAEADALAMDLNKHTTLQYRSPEMVEPMLGWAVGLPSDVWALGVLLYKLCYYTTPFEEHGTLAIVNAKYTFPQYPQYSPRLQHLIASMLVEHPMRRPTVFEVLKTAHEMSGTRPEVDYPSPTPRSMAPALPPSPQKAKKLNMLDFTDAPVVNLQGPPQQETPSIQPQRRGRPTRDSMKASAPGDQPSPQMPIPQATTGPSSKPKLQLTGENQGGARLQYSSTISGHGRNRQSYGTVGSRHVPGKLKLPVEQPNERLDVRTSPSPQSSVDAFGAPKGKPPITVSSTSSPVDAFGVPKPSRGFTDAFASSPSDSSPKSTGFSDAFGMPGKAPLVKSPLSAGGFGDTFSQSFGAATSPDQSQTARSVSGFSDTFSGGPSPLEPTRVVSQPRSKQPSPSSPKKSNRLSAVSSGQSGKTERRASPSSTASDGPMTFEQRYPSIDELQSGDGKDASPTAPAPKKGPTPPPKDNANQHFRRASIVKVNRTGENSRPQRQSVLEQPQPRSTHVTGTAFKGNSLRPPVERADSTSPTADYLSMLDDEVEKEAHRPPPEDLMGDDDGLKAQLAPLRPTLSNNSGGGSRYNLSSQATAGSGSAPAAPPKPEAKPKPESLRANPDTTPQKPQGAAERATLPPISAARPSTNFNSESWSPLETMRAPGAPASPSPRTADSSDDEADGPEDAYGRRHGPSPPAKSPSPRPTTYQITGLNRPQSMFVSCAPARHDRRSSITDIVSRYEKMSTKPAANGHGEQRREKSKPPSVAKPASLRQASGTERDRRDAEEKPKPKVKPVAAAKPAALRQGGVSPTQATTQATTQVTTQVTTQATKTQNEPENPTSSRSNSPEKQQPVNLLIQRWNRGN